MRKFVPLDPESQVSQEHWAVIYVPRRSRSRFPANCLEIHASQDQALQAGTPDMNKFAAKVIGPSKSSEGQYIYYLVHWVGQAPKPGRG